MGYYSATKRNDVLIHNTKRMNLENIISKSRQTQKATYYIIPYEFSSIGKSTERKRLVIVKD